VIEVTKSTQIDHQKQQTLSRLTCLPVTRAQRETLDTKNIVFYQAIMIKILPLPCAVSELFAQVSASGRITIADRYGILAVLLYESASEEDLYCIDRILYALRQGRVQLTHELSAIH
jgi:proline racemase